MPARQLSASVAHSLMILPSLLIVVAVGMPANAGLPDIYDTDYAIPDGAIFVSTSGRDSEVGTLDAPLRSVAAAVNRAPNGGTIVIREGVYRETLGRINKRLTLQPYPHEQVWFKGSVEVTDWVQDGPGWRKDNWRPKFDQNSYNAGEIAAEHPWAGKPEMVFLDGHPFDQIGRLSDLKPRAFYVDYGQHALYIGDDPRGKIVEATQFGHALELQRGGSGSIIRGLGFAHYANVKHEGAVRALDGVSDILLENNAFAHNAGSSLLIYNCHNVTLRHNTFTHSGYQGLSAWKTSGLILEENLFASNNEERFATDGDYAGAAGAKIFASTNVTARKNEFASNHCTGLWFDGSCHTCNVICNLFSNNDCAGLHIEESALAIVVGNRVEQNRAEGLYISNSSDIRVYNNQLIDNEPNIAIQDDKRVNTDPEERAMGITYITGRVDLLNNLLAQSKGTRPMLWVRDYNSAPRKSAEQMLTTCDYNYWRYSAISRDVNLVEWWGESGLHRFHDLESFRAETGHESHGIEQQNGRTKMPSETLGYPLPRDIAESVGLPAGAAVPIGTVGSGP